MCPDFQAHSATIRKAAKGLAGVCEVGSGAGPLGSKKCRRDVDFMIKGLMAFIAFGRRLAVHYGSSLPTDTRLSGSVDATVTKSILIYSGPYHTKESEQ
jgi:hypothetical protein